VTEKNGNSRAEQYTEFNMSKNGFYRWQHSWNAKKSPTIK
jgi:hypothetical protein